MVHLVNQILPILVTSYVGITDGITCCECTPRSCSVDYRASSSFVTVFLASLFRSHVLGCQIVEFLGSGCNDRFGF